jgi:hypothetical protein
MLSHASQQRQTRKLSSLAPQTRVPLWHPRSQTSHDKAAATDLSGRCRTSARASRRHATRGASRTPGLLSRPAASAISLSSGPSAISAESYGVDVAAWESGRMSDGYWKGSMIHLLSTQTSISFKSQSSACRLSWFSYFRTPHPSLSHFSHAFPSVARSYQ